MCPIGSLVVALVLGHLVWGVDEASGASYKGQPLALGLGRDDSGWGHFAGFQEFVKRHGDGLITSSDLKCTYAILDLVVRLGGVWSLL